MKPSKLKSLIAQLKSIRRYSRYEFVTESQGLRYVAEHAVEKEGDDPETMKALKAIRIQFHLNSALVQLKANHPADAIKSTTNALEIEGISDADRAKAFYRRGQAYGKTKEDGKAIEDLKLALELNPNDSGVIAELNAARNRQKLRREKEKKVYSQMFSE
jgi:peptidyl-prolyl isomerase D